MKYIVYVKADSPCPYCRMAIDMLNRHSLDFDRISTPLDDVDELREAMRVTFGVNVRTFPVIVQVDGTYKFIGGYEELKESLTPVEEIDFGD